MKIQKFNENSNLLPQVGDYALCQEFFENMDDYDIKFNNFLKSNMGKIIKIYNDTEQKFSINGKYPYCIQFYNIPQDIDDYFSNDTDNNKDIRIFGLDEIKHFSKNKEDLEMCIYANKYNL